MEPNNYEQTENNTENNLELQSFDLGEVGGGTQIIFAHKAINDTEHYVFTLGNGPKSEQDTAEQNSDKSANSIMGVGKQLLSNFRMQFGGKKEQQDNQADADGINPQNMKLRCFKLSQVEGQKYNVQEYVTPQGISDVARLFGAEQGHENPEITQ